MNTESGWDGKERRAPRNGNGNGHSNGERSALERHAQTALGTIVTLGIVWVGNSVIELGKEQVKSATATTIQLQQVKENINNLQDQILRLSSDRVTAGDLRRIEDRIDRLERKK